jgi:signal peptidase I
MTPFASLPAKKARCLVALVIMALITGCSSIRIQTQDSDPPLIIVSSEKIAYKVAQEVAEAMPWPSDVCKIWNTGSMWPVLDSGCLVIRSQIPYSMLQLGDIVHWKDSKAIDLVHRLVIKNDGKFITKGDANGYCDAGYMTPKSYSGSVIAIVRFRNVPYRNPVSLVQLRMEERKAEILKEYREKYAKINRHIR